MASAIGIDEPLACLYRDLKIPRTIGEKLKREHGITSLAQLIDQRLTLFEFVKKNISPDAARLLAPVDYILERSKVGDHGASISSLFPLTNDPDTSFVYFLARGVETKGLQTQAQPPKATAASFRRKLDAGGKYWVFDEDREHWKNDVIPVSDSEEPDEDTLRSELCIDVDDSPWTLDEQLQNVVLLKLPEAVQIPIPLFRKLYAHQRVGVEWMADLYIGKTGGVLGDVSQLGVNLVPLRSLYIMCALVSPNQHLLDFLATITGDGYGVRHRRMLVFCLPYYPPMHCHSILHVFCHRKTLQSLAYLLCLMNTGAIRNALIVCPNAIVRTTWRSEALGLLKYFGLDCNIQVEVITVDMPEIQRTKILHAAKNW